MREAERPVRPSGRDEGVTDAAAPDETREPPVYTVGGMTLAQWRVILLGAASSSSPSIPFVLKNFYIFQITLAIIYAIAILGLNLLTGFNGQFSLGHSAFYAIGAYTAAIMMENLGHQLRVDAFRPRPSSASCSASCSGCRRCGSKASIWRSRPSRSRLPSRRRSNRRVVEHWTGGVQGIVIIKPDAPFGLPLNSDQWLYVFTVVVAIVMYVCAVNLVKSRTGRALIAIRDHPVAASAMGINVSLYKSLTFGVSALYTGVAGALGAIAIAFVAPDSFTFVLAVALFVGLVVGGVASIPGTLVGGLFVLFVPNIAESRLEGPGGRRLRRDPAARHLSDADGICRPHAADHRQDDAALMTLMNAGIASGEIGSELFYKSTQRPRERPE